MGLGTAVCGRKRGGDLGLVCWHFGLVVSVGCFNTYQRRVVSKSYSSKHSVCTSGCVIRKTQDQQTKHMRSFLLTASLFLLFSASASAQTDTIPLDQAFDFWVGDWSVSWLGPDSSQITGTNQITKILDDKVIQENFHDPSTNFKGRSLSVFNPNTQSWHQGWADNQGGYFDFVGEVKGKDRIFKTKVVNARGFLQRMVFTDIQEDGFTWLWQSGTADGTEWRTTWRIEYVRK